VYRLSTHEPTSLRTHYFAKGIDFCAIIVVRKLIEPNGEFSVNLNAYSSRFLAMSDSHKRPVPFRIALFAHGAIRITQQFNFCRLRNVH
jgi:hypothetical protein